MTVRQPERESLYVPDRFEGLRDVGTGSLRSIIAPIEESLERIDERFMDMRAAGRGSFMILRGDTGAGKSTFLDTLGLFRQGVVTERIPDDEDIDEALRGMPQTSTPRVIVLEGREALGDVSEPQIEAGMHAINSFLRSSAGRDTLVVWPANTDNLTDLLGRIAERLGAEALFGVGDPVTRFSGPPDSQYVGIAARTVAALNQGASLAALGISEEQAAALVDEARTVGHYLALVRRALLENDAHVRRLMPNEQFRLWTVVVAGNDPEGDVAALTRGGFAIADIDRLMTATGANIVSELRKHPDSVGILGTVLDAKIIHLDLFTVLALSREFGNSALHALMREAGMSTSSDAKAAERLATSELGLMITGESLGTRRRGKKPGPGTRDAFASLAEIARTNDALLNRAIGEGLQRGGLIESYETEHSLGTGLEYRSDVYVVRDGSPIRLEVMWRSRTGRAEIANYVLGKLGNYGKAIGLIH